MHRPPIILHCHHQRPPQKGEEQHLQGRPGGNRGKGNTKRGGEIYSIFFLTCKKRERLFSPKSRKKIGAREVGGKGERGPSGRPSASRQTPKRNRFREGKEGEPTAFTCFSHKREKSVPPSILRFPSNGTNARDPKKGEPEDKEEQLKKKGGATSAYLSIYLRGKKESGTSPTAGSKTKKEKQKLGVGEVVNG